jgi:hypothetical protein
MYALARRAGLPPDRAVTAAAVGMAESSGRTWVTSPNPDGGTNVGIWQLDTPGGKGAGYTVEQLADPWVNAQAMAKGSGNGQDWSAWQTYADGTQAQYMPAALTAATAEQNHGPSWIDGVLHSVESPFRWVAQAAGGAAGSGVSSLLPAPVTDFFDTADQFAQGMIWIINPANWMRVVAGGAGLVLAVAGVVVLVRAA